MRYTLEKLLITSARKDKSIYLLVNDLGIFSDFRKEFPNRFINCGIGEPNMVSVASGLSLEGNTPIIYSVAGFCIHRGFEQLKFDMCYRSKKLVIINAGAGLCYNKVGAGHYLVDDFALMGSLPRMSIFAPIDISEFTSTFLNSLESDKVSYIRTGLDNCPSIEVDSEGYIKKGDYSLTVVSTGIFSSELANNLRDLPVNILHINNIKSIKLTGNIIIIEDHIQFGGLSHYIFGANILDHIHLPDKVEFMAETREELLEKYGLDNESIRKKIKEYL